MIMRLHISIFTLLLPVVLTVKELPGEELPASDPPGSLLLKGDDQHLTEQQLNDDEQNLVVKRSISEIAARRRSALDKTFMRFGRSDPSISEPRVKLSGGNLMRFGRSKQSNFLRLGRGRNQDFMRFGRSVGNLMRFGRANNNLMRFGRGGNNMMRFGRANNNMMRFGRANNNMMRFGRANNNMMRFGRANLMRFGRGGNNLMRFGRSDEDFLNYPSDPTTEEEDYESEDSDLAPTTSSAYLRMERSVKDPPSPKMSNYADRQNDNFMRLGRSLGEKNYEDSEDEIAENQEQNSIDTDKLARIQKNKMYLNDNFMRMGRDSTEAPEEGQEGEAIEMIFPDESRKKRSLLTKAANNKTKPEDTETKDATLDISSVRHVNPDGSTSCDS